MLYFKPALGTTLLQTFLLIIFCINPINAQPRNYTETSSTYRVLFKGDVSESMAFDLLNFPVIQDETLSAYIGNRQFGAVEAEYYDDHFPGSEELAELFAYEDQVVGITLLGVPNSEKITRKEAYIIRILFRNSTTSEAAREIVQLVFDQPASTVRKRANWVDLIIVESAKEQVHNKLLNSELVVDIYQMD